MKKVNEINKVIDVYFALNKGVDIVPAKDLMPNFIKAGIFPKDNKVGLPIRNILRNLDSKNAKSLHEMFLQLREELGLTFIIVTHNEELAKISDRTITMKDGLVI